MSNRVLQRLIKHPFHQPTRLRNKQIAKFLVSTTFVSFMAADGSAQNFIRSLKVSSDPPYPGGPLKIEIARKAWDDQSFYIPNKAEVIADWLLSRFLKERAREQSSNPVLDTAYWSLLEDIISISTAQNSSHSSSNLWLSALVNRLPVVGILTSLLKLLPDASLQLQHDLERFASNCFVKLWPLVSPKLGLEILLDCAGAMLCRFADGDPETTINCLEQLCLLVISAYRHSLSNFSNKKKAYIAFLHGPFACWVKVVVRKSARSNQKLATSIYDMGIDTLLNADVLRQNRGSQSEHPFFHELAEMVAHETAVLELLPEMFASLVHVAKKNRSTLFGQSSSQTHDLMLRELRSYTMRFFVSCQDLIHSIEPSTQSWKTKHRLLLLVCQENLFAFNDVLVKSIFESNIRSMLDFLNVDRNAEDEEAVIRCLTTLARIDNELLLPYISQILPYVILSSNAFEASAIFLDLQLVYHVKTRTLNSYLATLCQTLYSSQPFMEKTGPRRTYYESLSSPLLYPKSDGLTRAIHNFVTRPQVVSSIEFVLTSVKTAWDGFKVHAGFNDTVDTTRADQTSLYTSRTEVLATVLSLTTQLATIILPFMPIHLASDVDRSRLSVLAKDFLTSCLAPALKETVKALRHTRQGDTWALEVVVASFLRLRYVLHTTSAFDLEPSDGKTPKRIVDVLAKDELLGELRMEITRSLFFDIAAGYVDFDRVFTELLTYLEAQLSGSSTEQADVALLRLLSDRYLPIVNFHASQPQLERFLRIYIKASNLNSNGISMKNLLFPLFKSADFWELGNIRTAMLALLGEMTASLDTANDSIDGDTIDAALAYHLLLLFPVEYLSKSLRIDLVRRAFAADRLLSRHPFDENVSHLTNIRTFLQRLLASDIHTDQNASTMTICNYLKELLTGECLNGVNGTAYVASTVTLFEVCFSELLRTLKKSDVHAISEALQPLIDAMIKTVLVSNLSLQAFFRVVALVDDEFLYDNESMKSFFCQIYDNAIFSIINMEVTKLVSSRDAPTSSDVNLLMLWHSFLLLGKRLGIAVHPSPNLGKQLVSKALRATDSCPTVVSDNTSFARASFAILLQEVQSCDDRDRSTRIRLASISYVLFAHKLGAGGQKLLDKELSRACRNFSASDYSSTLKVALELMTNEPSNHLMNTIQLAKMLLHNQPKNTFKYMQEFATECIKVFINWDDAVGETVSLQYQQLDLIAQHCSERPIALRLMDINNIWTILIRCLAGCSCHERETNADMFRKIVFITSSLMRLRRDLVSSTLPQLTTILRRLVGLMRSLRGQLGMQQRTVISNTQPRWLSADTPLGVEEARWLSRLLETLTAKTVPRNNVVSTETHKAESLAKAFSKHAAYVLEAYVEAVNDPFCIMSSDLRKDLYPGLFALCGMISDHNRDALMLSALDAGGKATMKSLWREYEKQKYVGKG